MKSTADSVRDVNTLINGAEESLTPSQNGILVLGYTGDGKSTLVNYLAKVPLVAKFKEYPPSYRIETQNQNLSGVTIFHSSVSGTTVPGKWVDPQTDATYFDCPGFDDTRGPEQDIANGFFINKLFNVIQNSKFLIVVAQNAFSDKASKFSKMLKIICGIFSNPQDLTKASILVVTKASSSDETALKTFLASLTNNFAGNTKSVLDYFAGPNGEITFFMEPRTEGPIDNEDRGAILSKINSVSWTSRPQVKIAISPDSDNILASWGGKPFCKYL